MMIENVLFLDFRLRLMFLSLSVLHIYLEARGGVD